MQVLPTLPYDIIRLIIKSAQLDIDTRLGLCVKPGRLTKDPKFESVRERLRETHTRRLDFWKRNEACRLQGSGINHALECIRTPDIDIGPRQKMRVNLQVWGPNAMNDEMWMVIEAIEHVDADPQDPHPIGGTRAYLRRSMCCRLPTGEMCPHLIDDEDEDDMI